MTILYFVNFFIGLVLATYEELPNLSESDRIKLNGAIYISNKIMEAQQKAFHHYDYTESILELESIVKNPNRSGQICLLSQGNSSKMHHDCLLLQFASYYLAPCQGQNLYLGIWGLSKFTCKLPDASQMNIDIHYGITNMELGFGIGSTYRIGFIFLACANQQHCLFQQNEFKQKGIGISGSRCGGGFLSMFINRFSYLFLFGSQFGLGGQFGTQTAHVKWIR